MNVQIENLVALLAQAAFEYPVAFHPGRDPELGTVLEVDAFDVPGEVDVTVCQRLGTILWPVAFEPDTVLPGAFDERDSATQRALLPAGTVWYEPRREPAGSR
jgi:hypothetical protein